MTNFLLEVGVEELPASFVASAIQQWQTFIPQSLEGSFLKPKRIQVYGTPRRLAVLIEGLPDHQPQQQEEIKGPPVTAAFKDGKPTKAAEGFARKQGISLDEFEIRPTDKGEFIFIVKTIEGRLTPAVLQDLVPTWIDCLEGKRFMRWADGDLRFSRPIRWLVALLDAEVLPIQIVNVGVTVESDRMSYVHRVLHPDPVSIGSATQYEATLEKGFVIVDPAKRQSKIETQIAQQAETVKGHASVPADLLQEVVHLVEWPTAIMGRFEPEFLEIPSEVTTTEMISHQRYFPVLAQKDSEELLPNFIAISNGDPQKSALITAGNERVIRARLSDGQFFFNVDLKSSLSDYLPRLETVTFQEDLGSMRSKVDRIVAIASSIAQQLHLKSDPTELIERTALLCKADLVSQMVGEFPELQGIMGQKYALKSNEPEAVATGIAEHYQPRNADDQLPQSLTGQVVAIADRLDTLISIFGLGMKPTGSSDPFALRRSASAIISIIWDGALTLNLKSLITETAQAFANTFNKHEFQGELIEQLEDFFVIRMRTLLQDELKIDYDLVNAALSETDQEYRDRALADAIDVRDRAQFLQSIRNNGTLAKVFETVNRASKLAQKGNLKTDVLSPADSINPKVFEADSEQAFYNAILSQVPQTKAAQAERNYQKLVDGLEAIAPVISQFFDGEGSVLVMADNPAVRENRLNLLGLLRNHARVLSNFGEIVKG
jgi:glycyl-tRNA synthetase beta chain